MRFESMSKCFFEVAMAFPEAWRWCKMWPALLEITDWGIGAVLDTPGGFGNRLRNHACRKAWDGLILTEGSHSKHLRRKSVNKGSSHPFNAVAHSLLPGGPRNFPLLDLPAFSTVDPSERVVVWQYLGWPLELMKFFARFDWSNNLCGGIPSSSIVHANWSPSSSPGRRGYPVNSSDKMHPKLHMSIGMPYRAPNITSGAR